MRIVAYEWPGNIRELRSVIDYVTIRCKGPIAEVGDLPSELLELFPPPPKPKQATRELDDESERLLAALESCNGNRTRAARVLGISRATLYRRLAAFGIR